MKNNLITATALAIVISTGANAQSINPDEVGALNVPASIMLGSPINALDMAENEWSDSTVDTLLGVSIGTATTATLAAWALPAAVAHSSGAAILYSGAGYVAGSMGLAAGTVVALPLIAAAAVGTGVAVASYKYKDEIGQTMSDFSDRIEEALK
jgi:hypothetical protein